MPQITPSHLVCYSSLSRPTNDTSASGGGIDTLSRPTFSQWDANAVAQVVSNGADTRTVTIVGRRSSDNTVQTEILTLNGATAVTGAVVWERIQSVTLSAVDASRTVTIRQGVGGTARITIGPNETTRHMQFRNAQAEAGAVDRYEKQCWKNTHPTETLFDAFINLLNDPANKHFVGVDTALNSASSVANRKTAPAGVAFVGTFTKVYVPTFNLPAGQFCGVWVKQSLEAGDAAVRSYIQVQLQGASN